MPKNWRIDVTDLTPAMCAERVVDRCPRRRQRMRNNHGWQHSRRAPVTVRPSFACALDARFCKIETACPGRRPSASGHPSATHWQTPAQGTVKQTTSSCPEGHPHARGWHRLGHRLRTRSAPGSVDASCQFTSVSRQGASPFTLWSWFRVPRWVHHGPAGAGGTHPRCGRGVLVVLTLLKGCG